MQLFSAFVEGLAHETFSRNVRNDSIQAGGFETLIGWEQHAFAPELMDLGSTCSWCRHLLALATWQLLKRCSFSPVSGFTGSQHAIPCMQHVTKITHHVSRLPGSTSHCRKLPYQHGLNAHQYLVYCTRHDHVIVIETEPLGKHWARACNATSQVPPSWRRQLNADMAVAGARQCWPVVRPLAHCCQLPPLLQIKLWIILPVLALVHAQH